MNPDHSPPRTQIPDLLEPSFDWRQVGEALRTVRLALARHRLLALAAFALAAGASVLGLLLAPPTYRSDARILIQRNEQTFNLGELDRTYWREVQPPAQGAAELIRSRAVLEGLIDRLQLIDLLERQRSLPRRALGAVFPPPADAATRRAVALEVLEKRIATRVSEDGSAIAISAEWRDPQTARALAQGLVDGYLAARRQLEIGTLAPRVDELQSQAEAAQARLARAVQQVSEEHARTGDALEKRARQLQARAASWAERQTSALRAQLLARRKTIEEYEEARTRNRAALEQELRDLEARLAPEHPAVRQARAALAAADAEPAALAQLRQEERALFERYVQLGGKDPALFEAGAPLRGVVEAMLAASRAERDPALKAALQELASAQADAGAARARLERARLELAAVRTSFDQRYQLVQPPLAPRRPVSPQAAKALAGGAVAGVLLALFCALAAHLREARLEEPWQIRRQLGLPVLAQVRVPPARPPAPR